MSRNVSTRIHAVAGTLALLLVASFFTATTLVELFGDADAILSVKRLIVCGLVLLVPVMAAVGLSGSRLAGSSQAPLIRLKRQRMALIAVNGLLVLTPCAIVLFWLANQGEFGMLFTTIQLLELLAGALNITLLTLNLRLGFRMRRKRMPVRATTGV